MRHLASHSHFSTLTVTLGRAAAADDDDDDDVWALIAQVEASQVYLLSPSFSWIYVLLIYFSLFYSIILFGLWFEGRVL